MPTLTFKTLYVLIFIAHGRRELMHVNVTANPTAAWVWRQLVDTAGEVVSGPGRKLPFRCGERAGALRSERSTLAWTSVVLQLTCIAGLRAAGAVEVSSGRLRRAS